MTTKQEEIDRLIEQFDPESSFRRLAGWSAKIIMVLCAGPYSITMALLPRLGLKVS
jgi:hypothetical protein